MSCRRKMSLRMHRVFRQRKLLCTALAVYVGTADSAAYIQGWCKRRSVVGCTPQRAAIGGPLWPRAPVPQEQRRMLTSCTLRVCYVCESCLYRVHCCPVSRLMHMFIHFKAPEMCTCLEALHKRRRASLEDGLHENSVAVGQRESARGGGTGRELETGKVGGATGNGHGTWYHWCNQSLASAAFMD